MKKAIGAAVFLLAAVLAFSIVRPGDAKVVETPAAVETVTETIEYDGAIYTTTRTVQ